MKRTYLSSCLSFSMEVLQVCDLVRMKLDISNKIFCASDLYQKIVFFKICNCKCKWNSMRILLVTLYLVYIYAHFSTLAERFYRFFTFLSSWNQFSNYVLVINFRSAISEKKKKKVVFEYKSESSNDLDFKIYFIEFFNTFLFFALPYHNEQQKFYYIIISQNNILSSVWLNLFVRLFWLLGWLWKWWRNWFTCSVSTMQLQSELMQHSKLSWNLLTLKWLRF